MSKSKRIAFFVIDYAHSDFGLEDPVVVRSDLSVSQNTARVHAACPWAEVIQREGGGYGAYEDSADAFRAGNRAKMMGKTVVQIPK